MTNPMVEFELEDDGPRVVVRAMLNTSQAVDLFESDLTRRGYSSRTITTYRRILDLLCDKTQDRDDVGQITQDDCSRFLDLWNRNAAGTRAHTYSVLSSFFKFLYFTDRIKRNPLEKLARPKRIPAEDLDVVTVSPEDVKKLIAEAGKWREDRTEMHARNLAVLIPSYMGARRHAISCVRLSDYDRKRQRMRFREKGQKVIWKPVPPKLAEAIDAAVADGVILKEPHDYLIPPGKTFSPNKKGDRDDRVVWRLVTAVAKDAGVKTHVHALRAAFAVYYLEQNTGDVEALKELMGHRSLTTTQVYLRKLDRESAMERVRTLDWDAA